ncbi:hypothetical protein QTP88_024074 [Uroleucon formosanum]
MESKFPKRKPTSPESLKQKPTGRGSESKSLKKRNTVPGNCIDEVWELTKGTIDKNLEKSEPYKIFMSPISCDQRTHTEELTLLFAELMNKSLGDLTDSLHINFMVEIDWLISQYIITGQRGKRMTLVYENCDLNLDDLQVIVMSANLCDSDWTKYAQGIWVSPKFPLKEEDNKSDGNSKTNFKLDILRYLKSFSGPILIPCIKKLKNVFFISSVPGKYTEPLWGHLYLKNILKKHACLPSRVSSEWPIVVQCSSLGSLGTTDEEYLGGICLPYNKNIHEKQLWLKNYTCLWKCSSQNRTNFTPHIKTYCRISSCCTEMSWLLLTSANLSKLAWGRRVKTDEQTNLIMETVAGVFVKDRLIIRLIETKFVDNVEKLIYLKLQKQNEMGQDLTTVKFEELYKGFSVKARDLLSITMEFKLHENMNDFLSSNIDGSDNPYTINSSESNSSSAVNADTPDSSSNMLNEVSDNTLDVTSNEKTKNH